MRTTFIRSCFCLLLLPAAALAQQSALVSGTVTDQNGARISGASIVAHNVETGYSRAATSDATGQYEFPMLPLGQYAFSASKTGFAQEKRAGVDLQIGKRALVDFQLRVGNAAEEITVTEDAAPLSLTAEDVSGLVAARQIKDLPLNGRSYDLLLTLNPGIVNFTAEKTGGIGVSNSTTGNNFAVSGNRPQQNIFLLNGVEFDGAAENNMQPGGASQQLLGIDGVREFNVLRDSYDAQYGKHPGAQVLIATQSGSNQFHGSIFEFLRNNALDAPNFFDVGSAPPFQRNQFGAAGGGPVKRDHTFLFANYEGYRQRLHQTSASFVPDLASRAAAAPSVAPLLSLWPTPTASSPDFNGIAEVFSSPLQNVREDFGTLKFDQIISSRDVFNAAYTIDDSADTTATPADPFSTDILTLREQVLSAEETHTFSASTLNTLRLGYTRAGYFFTGEPTPGTPAANVPGFILGRPVGAVVVGGSAASNPQAQVGLAGSNNGSNLHIARNLFTAEDRVALTRGRHQFTFGAWFQPFQSNETIALSQFGQATFTSLQTFLQGTVATFLYDPSPTEMNWRSLFGAWYAQDVMRLTPRLTVSLGFRDEFSTGWNEANGHAANYTFFNGVISNQPRVGDSLFTVDHQAFLPQPRVGVSWSPFSSKTVVRAGFGIYNDLQDALGYRADQNAPFSPTFSIASLPVSQLPINTNNPVSPTALLVPGGVQPDLKPPTLISYSLRIERELSPNTSLSVGYVGSHGYHEIIGIDANEPSAVVCPASPCPATFPSNFPAPLAGSPVPAGTFFVPTTTRANPTIANTWTWFGLGASLYNSLQVDANRRFAHGLSIRGVYTWSKALDDGDSLNQTTAGNAPGLVSNPLNLRADWGPATYDVRHAAVISANYDLPFGTGQPYFNSGTVATKLASGWSMGNIITVQSGFPFTPQLSYNPSRNGDTRNPVRPFANPNFSGPIITGNPNQWFNPAAFLAPPQNSGFYGNLGRDTLTGPGLATWDASLRKDTLLGERARLQLRVEVFNLLDRVNFNTPNLIVFTPSGLSGTAGAVNSTATSSRQIQLGAKVLW